MSHTLAQWIAIKRKKKSLARALRRMEALARAWVDVSISEERMKTLVSPRAAVVPRLTRVSDRVTIDPSSNAARKSGGSR